jgi:hypothetical protein
MLKLGGEAALINIARRSGRSTLPPVSGEQNKERRFLSEP